MHGFKTANAQPRGAHEATGLSAAAGQESSSHSSVLLQQRDPISDSPGMAFGGRAGGCAGWVAGGLPGLDRRPASPTGRAGAGLAHLLFLTLHPDEDGNGRWMAVPWASPSSSCESGSVITRHLSAASGEIKMSRPGANDLAWISCRHR